MSYLFEFISFLLNKLDDFRVQILVKPIWILEPLPLKVVNFYIYQLPLKLKTVLRCKTNLQTKADTL